MTPVRLEPAAPLSRVKHSTTEPLCSLKYHVEMPILNVVLNFKGHCNFGHCLLVYCTILSLYILMDSFSSGFIQYTWYRGSAVVYSLFIVSPIVVGVVSWGFMRKSACLVINPIMVYTCSYCFVFNCTTVSEASDSMTTLTLIGGSVPDDCLRLGPSLLNLGFSLALRVCVLKALFFVSSQFVKAAYSVTMNIFRKKNFFLNHLQK